MKKIKFNYKDFIKKITSFSPRQLEGEKKTADFLMQYLSKNKIVFKKQLFQNVVPKTIKNELIIDGKRIECSGCSFVGGEINDKSVMISSLLPSIFFQNESNINFNPKCKGISNSNFYFAPSLAVSHDGLKKVLSGKNIKGEILVEPKKYKAINILVGNSKNPKNICFAHYDSIKTGAIDNASGVSLLMGIIIKYKKFLEDNLFVFSAAEELSYEKPIYWGRGYRLFEKSYGNLFKKAKNICVIDCIGNGKPKLYDDLKLKKMGFPVKNLKNISKKVEILSADFEHLMSVYHSELDDGRGIKNSYLIEAEKILIKKIQS